VPATPSLLVNALAPAAVAVDRWSYPTAEGLLMAAGLFAVAGTEIMIRWYRLQLARAEA
jgi:hypothetical protein